MNRLRPFRWAAFGLAILLFFAPITSSQETEPTQFPVTLDVDFGPANKDPIHVGFFTNSEATPESILKEICKVKNGSVCCDAREVAGIDGVTTSPGANLWWIVTLNGSRDVSPFGTRLSPNDHVTWTYLYEDASQKKN
jgi:hypothetical protein